MNFFPSCFLLSRAPSAGSRRGGRWCYVRTSPNARWAGGCAGAPWLRVEKHFRAKKRSGGVTEQPAALSCRNHCWSQVSTLPLSVFVYCCTYLFRSTVKQPWLGMLNSKSKSGKSVSLVSAGTTSWPLVRLILKRIVCLARIVCFFFICSIK